MKTLNRYLLRELLYPFFMGIFIFTFTLIMDKIFSLSDLIVKYGVSVFTVFKLLIYILPATFAITIPMACLVAVMVVFSRLKADNELIAMKSSGISPLPMLMQLLVLGATLTLAMVVFNNFVLPNANWAYRNLYYDIVRQRAAIVIQEHVFVEDFDGYVFRVGDKNPLTGELKEVVVFIRGQKPGDPTRLILAKQGQLISDPASRRVMLKLDNGFMQIVQKNNPALLSRIDFSTTFLDLDINRELANSQHENQRSAREMSMGQITREVKAQKTQGQDINLLWVEFHKKLSIPFACLAFILIGAPAGMLAPKSGRYFSYFLAVLLIFLYYIFLSVGETFGVDGRMSPFLAMWLPNLLLLLAGSYGMIWVIQERPPFISRRWHRFKGNT